MCSLSYLKVYLQDAANRAEWNCLLGAWVLFRREGKERIHKTELHMRAEGLRWFLQSVGCPQGPCVVEPLTNITAGVGARIDPSRLVTMRLADGGMQLGYMSSVSSTALANSHAIPRPFTSAVGSLPFMTNLYSSRASDAEELRGHFDGTAGEVSYEAQDTSTETALITYKDDAANNKVSKYFSVIK